MDNETEFRIDATLRELLARNVPKKFNKSVESIETKQLEEYSANQREEDFRLGEIVRCLHPSPSYKNTTVLIDRLRPILHVYLAMKQTVDQVVDPQSVSKELRSLEAKLQTVEVRLRNDTRDRILLERLDKEHISDLGYNLKAFRNAGQIDEKITIAHLSVEDMLLKTREINSYFQYKADQVSGSGRRKNDYSVHYLVFALADLFREVGKIKGSIMVSFNDDEEPTGAFWKLVKTFCDHLDSNLKKEYKGNFPEMIKTLCRRCQKANYPTTQFTAHPDTQLLLDFMSVVHQTKSRK